MPANWIYNGGIPNLKPDHKYENFEIFNSFCCCFNWSSRKWEGPQEQNGPRTKSLKKYSLFDDQKRRYGKEKLIWCRNVFVLIKIAEIVTKDFLQKIFMMALDLSESANFFLYRLNAVTTTCSTMDIHFNSE